MNRSSQLRLGSVSERVDDVGVDIQTHDEGDTELKNDCHDSKTDSVVSSPVFSAYFHSLVN